MSHSVGDPDVDRVIRDLVAAYESAFADRELSYYLIGSWADGESSVFSDIDAAVVWTRGKPSEEDCVRGEAIRASLPSPRRLDVAMLAEEDVPDSLIGVNIKLSSRLIHGPDIRDRLPLPSLEEYTQSMKEGAYFFVFQILRGAEWLDVIDYPDPAAEFLGYAVKRIDAWYPPDVTSGLKEWVSTATRIARALVALQTGTYVGSKGGSISAYGELIDGEWAGYLALLYRKGKIEWAYRVPEAEADRVLLRELCERFLAFERHFLAVGQGF